MSDTQTYHETDKWIKEGKVSLNDLKVAPYQRPLDPRQIERINTNFHTDLARQIQVARRPDGTLYVLDGQHTAEVLKRQGFHEWSARFHDDLSYEEEANRFVWYNESTRRVHPVYKFNARLEAKNESTKEIAEVLSTHGLAVPGTETTPDFTPIRSVRMLERIYEVGGSELLSTTLYIAKKAWGHKEPPVTYNTRVLPGLSNLLLHVTQTLDEQRLIFALQTKELQPEYLDKLVKGVQGATGVVAKKVYVGYLNGVGMPLKPSGRKAYRLHQDAQNYPYLAIQSVELGITEPKRTGVWSQQNDMTMHKKIAVHKTSYLSDLSSRLAEVAGKFGLRNTTEISEL